MLQKHIHEVSSSHQARFNPVIPQTTSWCVYPVRHNELNRAWPAWDSKFCKRVRVTREAFE